MPNPLFTDIAFYTGAVTGVVTLVQGGRTLLEKGRETALANSEKRKAEVMRLLVDYEKNRDAFEVIFDYESTEDHHLRVDSTQPPGLLFTEVEMNTRRATDRCFEHLRSVYMSWRMNIIKTEDLGPWTYWVHRAMHRTPLLDFASACGYAPFIKRMAEATKGSEDIRCLEDKCPWWGKQIGPNFPKQRIQREHGVERTEGSFEVISSKERKEP